MSPSDSGVPHGTPLFFFLSSLLTFVRYFLTVCCKMQKFYCLLCRNDAGSFVFTAFFRIFVLRFAYAVPENTIACNYSNTNFNF